MPETTPPDKMSHRTIAILAATGVCLACETALVIADAGAALQTSLAGALVVLVPAAMHSLGVDFGKWGR